MKKYRTFTEFLSEKHAWQYVGLDDEMPDDFEAWLQDLDISDVIDWADSHAMEQTRIALDNITERLQVKS